LAGSPFCVTLDSSNSTGEAGILYRNQKHSLLTPPSCGMAVEPGEG
jgi:hypothetical protein